MARSFDSAYSLPWPTLFKQLDELYPCSLFVWPKLDPEIWVDMVTRHYLSFTNLREFIFNFDEDMTKREKRNAIVKAYREHSQRVEQHFYSSEERRSRLFEFDTMGDTPWEDYINFIGQNMKPKYVNKYINIFQEGGM